MREARAAHAVLVESQSHVEGEWRKERETLTQTIESLQRQLHTAQHNPWILEGSVFTSR